MTEAFFPNNRTLSWKTKQNIEFKEARVTFSPLLQQKPHLLVFATWQDAENVDFFGVQINETLATTKTFSFREKTNETNASASFLRIKRIFLTNHTKHSVRQRQSSRAFHLVLFLLKWREFHGPGCNIESNPNRNSSSCKDSLKSLQYFG